MSVLQPRLGETWFSRHLYKIELSFFLCTFLVYMSIYSTNILSVGLSIRLQKGKRASLLMDVVILVEYVNTLIRCTIWVTAFSIVLFYCLSFYYSHLTFPVLNQTSLDSFPDFVSPTEFVLNNNATFVEFNRITMFNTIILYYSRYFP